MSDTLIHARALLNVHGTHETRFNDFSADDLVAFEGRLERLRSRRFVRIMPTQPNSVVSHPSL